MTQVSRFWDGVAVGDATLAPYDAATEFARVMQSVSGAGGVATNQSAVFRGELNELAVTGAATPVSINTGRAITAGTWYENDAASTVAIPTPAALTRIDRIVLRKDWSAAVQTVRITRIAGAEGGAAPGLTQVWGTTWDEPLAQVSIDIAGVITLTDQRQFVGNNAGAGAGSTTGQVLNWNGTNATWTSQLAPPLGSVGAPTYSFVGDLNTGMWSSAADTIVWSTGGVISATLGSTGVFTVGATANTIGLLVASNADATTVATSVIPQLLIVNSNGTANNWSMIGFGQTSGDSGGAMIGGLHVSHTGGSREYALAFFTAVAGGTTTERIRITGAGLVGINQTTNTFMTQGVTIQQGGADNEILAFKSSDVAHGMTGLAETDTYVHWIKYHATNGGVSSTAFSSSVIAYELVGAATTGDATKSIFASGAINLVGALKAGTSYGAMGATDNILIIGVTGGAQFIFQSDGTSYENVGTAWVNYDEYDDVALLTDLSIAASRADDAIHQRFASFLRYSPEMLQAMDLIHFNADGHHFANRSKIQMALIGASRQLGDRVTTLERENQELRNALALA